MPRLALAFVTLLVAAVAGCGSTGGANPTGGNGGAGGVATFAAADRKSAPELSGELLDGSRYDPATYRGKVLVVNFWASWCAPCNTEAPELEAAHEATKTNAVFLGVNIRDDRDKAKAFVTAKSSYPSLFDPAGRVALGFRDVPPNSPPTTIVVDADGRIAAIYRRAVHAAELIGEVNSLGTAGAGHG